MLSNLSCGFKVGDHVLMCFSNRTTPGRVVHAGDGFLIVAHTDGSEHVCLKDEARLDLKRELIARSR